MFNYFIIVKEINEFHTPDLAREASDLIRANLNEIRYIIIHVCIIIVLAIIAVDSEPVTTEIFVKFEVIAALCRLVIHTGLVKCDP